MARSPSFGPVGCGVDFLRPEEADDQMFPKASPPDFAAGLVFPRPAKALDLGAVDVMVLPEPMEVVVFPVEVGASGTEVK